MPKPFTQVVKPYNDDPFIGHLSTPISDSDFVRTYIRNLPGYRRGLSPLLRGLEVGLAHGYFLAGPWTVFGPLRDSEVASLGGLICALALVLIGTACLSVYGIVSFQGKPTNSEDSLQSSEGWSQFSAGFFLGGTGGAFVAYFLLQNFDVINGILSGTFN
ncbi:Photosystem I reaction center subunit XI [Stanieria cyanosphaera PCC 7437]|uniref:Photosystem I reaction center subunit XI n=1 Tax=Stanieria cyanosphaera (strain ATCC 29371 / PCC 7437) TaxID=111780 RepID=K9XTS2_STAC7|nr:photosystem I reaction center protein subunit XI [Stanieria cyanosphaera]AFZ36000.1 Photosystem I reaction center subunit XI [Stanieria cyanosphaera PCC 7437]